MTTATICEGRSLGAALRMWAGAVLAHHWHEVPGATPGLAYLAWLMLRWICAG